MTDEAAAVGVHTDSPVLDVSDVLSLLGRLEIEEDEVCAVSFAAPSADGGRSAALAYGSLLFGPRELATLSWPKWSARTNHQQATLVSQWEAAGVDLSQWHEFAEYRSGWCFGRFTFSGPRMQEVVAAWLADLLAGAELQIPIQHGPRLSAVTHAAHALLRSFPLLASPAGLLATST